MENKAQTTELLVKGVFKEFYGDYPKTVLDIDGAKPSAKNNYLYIETLNAFRGVVIDKNGFEIVFSIFGNEKGEWEAMFTPKKVDG